MIRRDEIDHPLGQRLPKCLAVGSVADRRSTFVLGCAIGNLFSRKRQVVRASLDRDRQTLLAGLVEQWQTAGVSQVDNVCCATGFPAQINQKFNRITFK